VGGGKTREVEGRGDRGLLQGAKGRRTKIIFGEKGL